MRALSETQHTISNFTTPIVILRKGPLELAAELKQTANRLCFQIYNLAMRSDYAKSVYTVYSSMSRDLLGINQESVFIYGLNGFHAVITLPVGIVFLLAKFVVAFRQFRAIFRKLSNIIML